MAASLRSSAPRSLSSVVLDTGWAWMWKQLSQRKEQVKLPSHSGRRMGHGWGRGFCKSILQFGAPWVEFLAAQPKVHLLEKIHLIYIGSSPREILGWVIWLDSRQVKFKTNYASSSPRVCLTGVQISDSAYVPITQVLGSVRFENMDRYYKRGLPYFGQVGQQRVVLYHYCIQGDSNWVDHLVQQQNHRPFTKAFC